MLTSLQNPRVKATLRLRDGRTRRREGRLVIDGAREIVRAARAGIEFRELYFCEELFSGDETAAAVVELRTMLPDACEWLPVTRGVFEKLAYGDRDDGLLAVAETPRRQLSDLILPANPLVAVLAGVEKPGNLGAVFRSADGAGVSALIAADAKTDLWNPHVIRGSLGTIFAVSSCAADEPTTRSWLAAKNLTIYAAWVDAEQEYTAVDFTIPCAIVLGSEADGLGPIWRGTAILAKLNAAQATGHARIVPIKLPMLGIADSLNVSTAAAVLFYEALRQRRAGKVES